MKRMHMLVEWYLRRQLKNTWPAELGTVADVHALGVLAHVRQCIFPDPTVFYTSNPVVQQFFAVHDQTLATKQRVLQLSASLVQQRPHPLFQAVVRAAVESGQVLREAEVDVISELGVTGKLDSTWYVFGDAECMLAEQMELGVAVQTLAYQFEQEGKYVLFCAQKKPKRLIGVFACSYPIHPAVSGAVAALRAQGIESVLLSELNARIMRGLATELGINLVHGDLDPTDERAYISSLLEQQPASIVVVGSEKKRAYANFPCVVVRETQEGALLSLPRFQELPLAVQAAARLLGKCKRWFFWIPL